MFTKAGSNFSYKHNETTILNIQTNYKEECRLVKYV